MKSGYIVLNTVLLFALYSCQTDNYAPCPNTGKDTLACKRAIISNGKPQGLVYLEYTTSDLIFCESFYNPSDKHTAKRKYYYTQKRLDSVLTHNSNSELSFRKLYLYNPSGRLIESEEQNLNLDPSVNYKTIYQYSSQLDSLVYFENGAYKGYQKIIYQNNSEKRYKIIDYNKFNDVTQFALLDTFENGYATSTIFNNSGKKIGQETKSYNSNGQIKSIEKLGPNNIEISNVKFEYDNKNRLVKKQSIKPNTTLENYDLYFYPQN